MRLVLVIPSYASGRADSGEQRIALAEDGIEVGGAADCDAVLDHPSVGTTRVRLERRGEAWVVIDRDGRGASSVGGVALRAREPRIVRPPHSLRLGDVELSLELDPEAHTHDGSTREVALRAAAFIADVAPARPRVRVVEGSRMGDILELDRGKVYRVGRAADSDLLLDERDASREHVSIERQNDRVVVRDLGSAHGSFLGRSRLEPRRGAVWEPWRMLRVADTVLSLEIAIPDDKARLLAPLSRLEDPAAAHTASVPEAIPARPMVDEVDAATAPVTAARPNAEVAPLPEPATAEALGPAKKPKRDVTILIPVLAVVTGLLAIAALVAVLVE